jgi:hypothetical protein
MKIPFNKNFQEQQIRYSFKFTCENCMYFDYNIKQCAHEYPNEEHSIKYYMEEPLPEEIVFCKQFELV